jgi:hypothetical protein
MHAYPLSWPANVQRAERKADSRFKTTLPAALKNVRLSLEKFGRESSRAVTEIVISSNVTLGQERPRDTGVAVWFKWDGDQRCIAVDRYPKIEDNLQAIHHVLEARCVEMRHAGIHIIRSTMQGFVAKIGWDGGWRAVLGLDRAGAVIRKTSIEEAYRRLAETAHPDKGGSQEEMAKLNVARDAALKELGA